MRFSLMAVMLAWGVGGSVAAQAIDAAAAARVAAQAAAPQSAAPLPMGQRRFTKAGASSRAGAKGKAIELPPNAAVVTMRGLCVAPQQTKDCKTVITRADLDGFASGFSPTSSDSARGRMAFQYAGTLAFATLAEQHGFEKNPQLAKEIDTQLKFLRMRILASAFLQGLDKQAPAVGEDAIKKYYTEHQSEFERAQVRRVALPLLAPTMSGKRLELPALRAEMEELRSKAVAGGDLNELLKSAFAHLQINAMPPALTTTTLRKGDLQGDDEKAFSLQPGEISPVIDSAAAFSIFKMESKETVPFEAARNEIEATLRQQEIRDQIRRLTGQVATEFNLPYLHMSAQPDVFGLAASQAAKSGQKNAVAEAAEVKTTTAP